MRRKRCRVSVSGRAGRSRWPRRAAAGRPRSPGPEAAAPVAGSAVVQGTVTGAGAGLQVGVVGTSLVGAVDDEGQFVLVGVPAGTATLRFEGAGVDARVPVPGLQDGLVTSITVQLSGGTAQLTGDAELHADRRDVLLGRRSSTIAGTQLVVAGRRVDASQIKKVWRGGRRIQLSDLQVGEKLKVWGTLRGDGVVVAEEIEARTPGAGPTGWVEFSGEGGVGRSASAPRRPTRHLRDADARRRRPRGEDRRPRRGSSGRTGPLSPPARSRSGRPGDRRGLEQGRLRARGEGGGDRR